MSWTTKTNWGGGGGSVPVSATLYYLTTIVLVQGCIFSLRSIYSGRLVPLWYSNLYRPKDFISVKTRLSFVVTWTIHDSAIQWILYNKKYLIKKRKEVKIHTPDPHFPNIIALFFHFSVMFLVMSSPYSPSSHCTMTRPIAHDLIRSIHTMSQELIGLEINSWVQLSLNIWACP